MRWCSSGRVIDGTLKMTDYESIKNDCNYIKAISPVVTSSGQFILWQQQHAIYYLRHQSGLSRNQTKAHGGRRRHVTDTDIKASTKVCILGQTVVDNLFPDGSDPIGKVVRFNAIPFRVVGVPKKKATTPWVWTKMIWCLHLTLL